MSKKSAREIAQPILNRDKEVMKRREELLRAAYDLLKRNSKRFYVKEASSEMVHYDETDCDGSCLMEDIAII